MPSLHRRPGWSLPAAQATPEHAFRDRRTFLGHGLGLAGALLVPGRARAAKGGPAHDARFALDCLPTAEQVAARCNPFVEIAADKADVWRMAERLRTTPWSVEIAGLCRRPGMLDLDDMARRFAREERVYRHRCVEAWATVVPWMGFPLRRLVDAAQPDARATHVRFVSALIPEMPGQRADDGEPPGPWPYCEGLRLDEACHELTFVATGMHGKPLLPQHGAPIRLVVPWKYAFKSAKSIVRIEFVDRQPATFWSSAAPHEYDFLANVDPGVPHPRWSQRSERLLGTGELRATEPFNGYGAWVAGLYR